MDTTTGKERLLIVKSNLSAIEYSPRESFLITCEKFTSGEKNLIVWSNKSGKEVCGFEFKKQSKEGPKSIKFTKNETYCARLASRTTIDIFDVSKADESSFEKPKFKLVASAALLAKGKKG